MPLSGLRLEHVRNIAQVDLHFSTELNIITGRNASGKTSLLEALFILSRGKSFRVNRLQEVIQHNQPHMRIIGRVASIRSTHVIGFERTKHGSRLRVDGEEQRGFSLATKLYPIIEITPNSHEIVERGPSERRRFLDWGVFHVEHQYGDRWRRYMRALRQRNAALRQYTQGNEQGWRESFIKESEAVHDTRARFFEKYRPLAEHRLTQLVPELAVDLTYYPGWDEAKGLVDTLQSDETRDRRTGMTHHGPQRADLKLKVEGVPLQQAASRGQQKTVVMALKLAMVDVLALETEQIATLLVDDLASELDGERRQRVVETLSSVKAQKFITAIESDQLELSAVEDKCMFHVEQGVVKRVD